MKKGGRTEEVLGVKRSGEEVVITRAVVNSRPQQLGEPTDGERRATCEEMMEMHE